MNDPRDVAAAIQRLRGRRQQQDLARVAKVHHSTWSKWEKGATAPRQASFPLIAKALGCSLEQLQSEIWKSSRERLGSPEDAQAASDLQPERRLLEETERMIRTLDSQADNLRGLADILRQYRTVLLTDRTEDH
jgi:transcriptional regulator with XRE-family HTH domain